jgi:hypothetical protein
MRNHHYIHTTAFGPPSLRERAWFVYAWLMEAAIQSLNLLRPRYRRNSWEFLRGVSQFWLEWMWGRPHQAATHAHGVRTEGTA